MQLVPEQGHHWVRSTGRREEVADACSQSSSGSGCTAAVASSFLMPSLCPTKLWKEIKKGKKKGKKRTAAFLYDKITPFPYKRHSTNEE